MKKKNLLLMGVFSLGLLNAQVGINTQTPLSVFHIDGKANTTTSPSVGQLIDDIVVQADGSGGIGMGIGTIPAEGASVDLASPSKGLSLNSVALTGPNDLSTVLTPKQGMLVFNTRDNDDLARGICLFNGTTNQWEQMAYTKQTNIVNIAVSLENVITTPSNATHIAAGGYDGVSIPFAPLGSSTPGIKITEDGTYAFALNLIGSVDVPETSQSHLYLFLMRKSDMTIMDAAALGTLSMYNPPYFKQSATAILASELKNGDELDFLICHNNGTDFPWTLFGGTSSTTARYNKTSLSYWKL
ncbi:hypothetical protein [Dysgonomonas macrotermitis]|nr:hypothetical protein [Dysgonomonas macrotermitis]